MFIIDLFMNLSRPRLRARLDHFAKIKRVGRNSLLRRLEATPAIGLEK